MAWIAADIDGEIYMFVKKPIRDGTFWIITSDTDTYDYQEITNIFNMFDIDDFNLTWEDEPIEVEIGLWRK